MIKKIALIFVLILLCNCQYAPMNRFYPSWRKTNKSDQTVLTKPIEITFDTHLRAAEANFFINGREFIERLGIAKSLKLNSKYSAASARANLKNFFRELNISCMKKLVS